MEYGFMYKSFGVLLGSLTKDSISNKDTMKKIRQEYKNIILRAKDIGKNNRLWSSYSLAAFYIAMNRNDGFSPEENYRILDKALRRSKLLKISLGDADSYLSEKKMPDRMAWSKETHKKKYENDWVVDVLPKTDKYDLGYDYLECGVCKLCRDENCFELAKYLCKLDFMLVEIIGIKLTRTQTLAEGGEKCDFRFKR